MSSVPCQTGGQGKCADATVVSAAFTAIAAGVPMPDVLTILSIYYNPCNLQQFWVGDGETTCGLSDLYFWVVVKCCEPTIKMRQQRPCK